MITFAILGFCLFAQLLLLYHIYSGVDMNDGCLCIQQTGSALLECIMTVFVSYKDCIFVFSLYNSLTHAIQMKVTLNINRSKQFSGFSFFTNIQNRICESR